MNEQEAIEQLQGEYLATNGTETPARVRYHNEALSMAIAALKEVQEYHDTGYGPKAVRELARRYYKARKSTVEKLERLKQYEAINTPEQCQTAVERTRWIPVSEQLPEERDSIFAKLKGTDKWKTGMFEKTSGTTTTIAMSAPDTAMIT